MKRSQAAMQWGGLAHLICLTASLLATGAAALPVSYGPGNCVTIKRSPEGNCIIHTECAGQDTSSFDFSFQCVSARKALRPAAVTLHSMGVGSFGEEDELDTEVQCARCLPPGYGFPKEASTPAQTQAVAKPAPAPNSRLPALSPAATAKQNQIVAAVGVQSAKQDAVAEPSLDSSRIGPPQDVEVATYGPSNCVQTWRSPESKTCIIRTDCLPETVLSVYNFGFLCEDEEGDVTRHLFGQDSFSHQETFDTEISCSKCLALKDSMDATKEVASLKKKVEELTIQLKAVKNILRGLMQNVGSPAPAMEAPAEQVTSMVDTSEETHQEAAQRQVAAFPHGHVQGSTAAVHEEQDDDTRDDDDYEEPPKAALLSKRAAVQSAEADQADDNDQASTEDDAEDDTEVDDSSDGKDAN